MIYTVTFNPAIDYVAKVDKLVLGETNRTAAEVIHPGGKGLNVSIVLKHLGVESRAIGFVGGWTGEAITEMVVKTGITADFIRAEGITRINVKIKERLETEINGKGVIVGDNEMDELYRKLNTVCDGDWLVLAGSIPGGMQKTLYAEIMRRLSGKNINFVVDATGDLLINTLPYRPFLIKPNTQELEEIFGVKIIGENDVIVQAKKLIEMGARNIVVSMGGDGAIMVSEDGKAIKLAAPEGKVVDTVGAGDSLVAGFIAGYVNSGSLENAFVTGVAAGSATAFSPWLAEKNLVDELIPFVKSNVKTF